MSLPDAMPDPEPEPQVPPGDTQGGANLPPPVLIGPDNDNKPPPYTAGDWGLFALGALVALVSPITYLLGSIGLLVWFFVARPPRPPFLRGVGLGLAILGALLLGAFTVCLIMLGVSTTGNKH